jgi:hypothetical protein
MERASRLESARRKLRVARYVVIASSTAAFGGFALMTRASHAGTSTAGTASSSTIASSQSSGSGYSDDSSSDDSQSQSFDYGGSSISPSGNGGSVVQSSGS